MKEKPIHLNSIYTLKTPIVFSDDFEDHNVIRFAISSSIGCISIEAFDASMIDYCKHLDVEESVDFIDAFLQSENVEFTIEHI